MVFLSIIAFALILSFLVIIHELGHYLAAKWQNIRVTEFGLGYPPRALKLFERWGTIFTLNWVPFGGFVNLDGENGPENEVVPENTPKSKSKKSKKDQSSVVESQPFYSKSSVGRLIVILAGAFVNFVFGVLVFSFVFSIAGIPSGAIVESTAEGSPAQTAGIQAQSAITSVTVDGKQTNVESSYSLIQIVQQHIGEEVGITTTGPCEAGKCGDEINTYQTYIRHPDETPEGQGSLGVTFDANNPDFIKFYPWYEMPFRGATFGIKQALFLGWQILLALQNMFSQLFSSGTVPQDLTGPVGIVHQATNSGLFFQGPLTILLFTGMLSINLAIMNVLPIPALDGGRALFIILEKVVGKSRIQQIEGYANYGGMVVLIGLILLITARDIFRVVTGG